MPGMLVLFRPFGALTDGKRPGWDDLPSVGTESGRRSSEKDCPGVRIAIVPVRSAVTSNGPSRCLYTSSRPPGTSAGQLRGRVVSVAGHDRYRESWKRNIQVVRRIGVRYPVART